MITNPGSKTRVDEVADGIYRISTPVDVVPGGFSFNQYLVVDEEPLLFHTGPRRMFPLVREAVAAVLPVERLRHVGFSHFEADECGSLNEFLAVAPDAAPLCGRIAAMVSVDDEPLLFHTGPAGCSRSSGRRWPRSTSTRAVPPGLGAGYFRARRTVCGVGSACAETSLNPALSSCCRSSANV